LRILTFWCPIVSAKIDSENRRSKTVSHKIRRTKTLACSGVTGSPIKQAVNSFSREMTPSSTLAGVDELVRKVSTFFQGCWESQLTKLGFHRVREIQWSYVKWIRLIASSLHHTWRKDNCSSSFKPSTSIVCLTIGSEKSASVWITL
jgi:hypothetical protein